MSVPRSILPRLAGVSCMARSVLLAAYAMADEHGEATRIMSAGRDVLGQDRTEVVRSLAELTARGLVKYEHQGHRGWVLTLLEWGV